MRTLAIAAAMGVLAAPLQTTAFAQAAPAAPTVGELARARDLYLSAEQHMRAGNFGTAAAAYAKAFALSHDAVLLFKIAGAHQRAGHCDAAIRYYQRYLVEASPSEEHVTLTNERITSCHGDPTLALPPMPTIVGAEETPVAPLPTKTYVRHKPNDNLAWLIVGGGIAFLTLGSVLAYSADASENDIEDLYAGFGGRLPEFDEDTRAEYDSLVAEGERYQNLSLLSFGLAAVSGGIAGYLFWKERQPSEVRIEPTATSTSAGISATLRF